MDPDAENSSSDEDSSSEDTHVDDPVRKAISTINDGNGVDIDGIYEFVKARHNLMPNYREVLEVELNTRVSENELEKVDNLYRIIYAVSSKNTNETTEAESAAKEPVAVAHPANTSSDLPSSSSLGGESNVVLSAIRALNDGNGADVDEIFEYLQGRYDLGPEHRKLVEEHLGLSVADNELEMVENRYRIINVVSSENTNETTEAESAEEPVAVAHPANTSSDTPSCSSFRGERFDDMVLKAIRTLNDGNGADVDEICQHLQWGLNLGPERRKTLVEEYLNYSVSRNVLEKVENRYRIVDVTSEDTNEKTETESKSVADSDDQKDPATSSSDYVLPYGDMPEAMVIEAIATMDYGFGVDIDEIHEYIENRYKIPKDYMKILEDELNKRVSEKELEKVEHGYKVLDVTSDNMDEAHSQAFAVPDPAKSSSSSDATTSSRNTPYYDPVIDAVKTINDGNGVDIDGILEFIEAKYERNLSPDYRKRLEGGLKRRVSQCILEKVESQYKILDLTPEKLEEISEAAAEAVAVSDQKDLEAKEASEAADRAKKVLEENELVLQMAKEALNRCTRGD